jgi:hypothetical protein
MSILKRLDNTKKKDKVPRILVELSREKKAEIVRYHIKYPAKKNVDLIAHFEKEFKVKISSATMSRILNKFDLNDDISDDTYRLKSAKYPQLEDALYIWHQQKRSLKIPISDDILIEQAKVFGQYLSIDENDFKYSHGWLEKFKSRLVNF